jgi:hypothetical protein
MQIICRDGGLPVLAKFLEGGWEQHIGKCMEKALPYTHVSMDFRADRFGETRVPQTPEMDYYGQCPLDIELVFNMKGAKNG